MKLNIEKLVRQTFTKQDAEALLEFQTGSLEDLVGLIVERCALVAEELQDTGNHIGECPASAWEQGTLDSAEAIRNLLED